MDTRGAYVCSSLAAPAGASGGTSWEGGKTGFYELVFTIGYKIKYSDWIPQHNSLMEVNGLDNNQFAIETGRHYAETQTTTIRSSG